MAEDVTGKRVRELKTVALGLPKAFRRPPVRKRHGRPGCREHPRRTRKPIMLVCPSRSVVQKPPKIQLVGLLPAILKPCGPACAQPFTNKTVGALKDEEVRETPPIVLETSDRAHAMAEKLFRDFGDRIRIEVVSLDSPMGVWVGLKHRVGRGFAVVVDGKTVVRDPADYAPVRAAVERVLGAHAPSA